MKRFVLTGALIGVLAFATASTAPAAQKAQNVVICFNGPADNGGFATPVYRTEPKKCTFTSRKSNKPFGFASVVMGHLTWKSWGSKRAHGSGKEFVSTVGPVPAKVFLSRARERCGHTVFTHARFTDPSTGNQTKLTLHTCPS